MRIFDKIAESLKGPHNTTGMAIAAIVIVTAIDKFTGGQYELSAQKDTLTIRQRPEEKESKQNVFPEQAEQEGKPETSPSTDN